MQNADSLMLEMQDASLECFTLIKTVHTPDAMSTAGRSALALVIDQQAPRSIRSSMLVRGV
jgi:hypothetical protein